MELEDLYKLVYQGVMGSGHAVSSDDAARGWLKRETDTIGISPGEEKLCEEISADGEVVRINLRPFIASGGNTHSLLTAFIRTGREYRGSTEELEYRLISSVSFQNRFTEEEMKAHIELQKSRAWPAIHHSETYSVLYKPAYRVALKELCVEEGIQFLVTPGMSSIE
jgi:hypothetical protein